LSAATGRKKKRKSPKRKGVRLRQRKRKKKKILCIHRIEGREKKIKVLERRGQSKRDAVA